MDEQQKLDFWYAVNNTEIILKPRRHLETFGNTIIHYHLVSELMDSVDQVRIREGRMVASQPKIITPDSVTKEILENFGTEAQRYVEWMRQQNIRILQYGCTLRKEEYNEHVATSNLKTIVEQVKDEVAKKDDPLRAIVVGVDKPWDVCLIKLFSEVVNQSARANVTEMVDTAFLDASRDPAKINTLAKRLQELGVFERMEDRFFALVKGNKRK